MLKQTAGSRSHNDRHSILACSEGIPGMDKGIQDTMVKIANLPLIKRNSHACVGGLFTTGTAIYTN